MFVVTLISPRGCLNPALVESLRNAWGGGDAIWLSPDEAAEFTIAAVPGNRWDVWQDLQDQQVDLIVQAGAGRRKRMLLADMDSTMIRQECIDELAEEAGVGAHVRDITARAMNGELDFEGALIERVKLMKGLPAEVIGRVLEQRITYMPGGDVLLATMRANGAHTALVSGGFTEFTARVAAVLGFHENRANTLIIRDNHLTGAASTVPDAPPAARGSCVAPSACSGCYEFGAGIALKEQQRAQVAVIDPHIALGGHGRFGMKRYPGARPGQHAQVVGAVTDRNHLGL